ncbi:MAG: hypothetical protein WCI97_05295 [Bacteroidota bacterium]
MEKGDRIIKQKDNDDFAMPKFIWDVYYESVSGKSYFIVNAVRGANIAEVKSKLKDYSGTLPNHAKFELLTEKELRNNYIKMEDDDSNIYLEFSTLIRLSRGALNLSFEINSIYFFIYMKFIFRLKDSPEFIEIEKKIINDPYSLIIKNTNGLSEKDTLIIEQRNYIYEIKLGFIPRMFFMLKIIKTIKDMMSENFPATDTTFSNSLYENLFSGKLFSEGAIKKTGDIGKNKLDSLMFEKFKEAIDAYNNLRISDDKISDDLSEKQSQLPDGFYQKEIIMEVLKFDMSFWQILFLKEIEKDIPVAKPHKNGISETYNYMLLLPYFKWLSPDLFPEIDFKHYTQENYRHMIFDRMKSFQTGKLLLN